MIEGAIIGALVGGIIALVKYLGARKRKEQILGTLNEKGAAAARAQLDSTVPAIKKIPLGKIIVQYERMAWLTIINDTEALAYEAAEHTGQLTAVAQVNAMALIGLATRSQDPAPHARALVELSTKMNTEGGRMMKLVKTKLSTFADLTRAIAGEQVEAEFFNKARMAIAKEQGMPKVVLQIALAMALEAAGSNGDALRTEVKAVTTAFDKPAVA